MRNLPQINQKIFLFSESIELHKLCTNNYLQTIDQTKKHKLPIAKIIFTFSVVTNLSLLVKGILSENFDIRE